MKLRSLAREWRIRKAPRPFKDQRPLGNAAPKKPPRSFTSQPVEFSAKELDHLRHRLNKAAVNFWPVKNSDEREERVSHAVCEAIERLKQGERHTISWWAKYMYGTSITAWRRNREDIGNEDNFWGEGSVPAVQDDYVLAQQMLRISACLPDPQRSVLLLRADGANAIEIATETSLAVDSVLSILAQAREWIEDGGAYLDTSTLTRARTNRAHGVESAAGPESNHENRKSSGQ